MVRQPHRQGRMVGVRHLRPERPTPEPMGPVLARRIRVPGEGAWTSPVDAQRRREPMRILFLQLRSLCMCMTNTTTRRETLKM